MSILETLHEAKRALERGRPQIHGALVQQDQDEAISSLKQAIDQFGSTGMTLQEAMKLGHVIATAHGGCEYCVKDLAAQLGLAFPQYVWEVDDRKQFPVVHARRRGA